MKLSPPLRVGQLRQNPELAQALGFKDDPSMKDNDEFYAKLTPTHSVEQSHHHGRWEKLDIEAPWFISQSRATLSEAARKIYGAASIRIKHDNLESVKTVNRRRWDSRKP